MDPSKWAPLVRMVVQDYGYTEVLVLSTLRTIYEEGGPGLLGKIQGSPMASDVLGLCVHSLSFPNEQYFSVKDKVESVLASSSFNDSIKGSTTLGFKWTAIVEVPMFEKYGRVTFSSDATFANIRASLSEFVSQTSSNSSLSSFASTFFAKNSSLIDDGSLLICILDDDGWSKEMTAGNFPIISSMIRMQQCFSSAGSTTENSIVSSLTITLRSTCDPFGARQRMSEVIRKFRTFLLPLSILRNSSIN